MLLKRWTTFNIQRGSYRKAEVLHHHQFLYSPCNDLGLLTPEVRHLIKTHGRTPLDE
jgi:hypothetical protein